MSRDLADQPLVRKAEFEAIWKHVRAKTPHRHVLVVGPSGEGKTLLLEAVAERLRVEDAPLLPLRLAATKEILDLADFWLEILSELARERAGTHDAPLLESSEFETDEATELRQALRQEAATLRRVNQVFRKLTEDRQEPRPADKARVGERPLQSPAPDHKEAVQERRRGEPEPGQISKMLHELIANRKDPELEKRARAAVLDAIDRSGRETLLIMLEDLQALCDNTDEEFARQLREVLHSERRIRLLTTATRRFDWLDDGSEPSFSNLFRMIELKPLDPDSCRALWQKVTGSEVSDDEIRPYRILSRGNPRLLAALASGARRERAWTVNASPRHLMEEVAGLIEDRSDYHRNRLDALPKIERRVYVGLLDCCPARPADIARHARLDPRVVSAMLARLTGRGMVVPHADGTATRTYTAADPHCGLYRALEHGRDVEQVAVTALKRALASSCQDIGTEILRQLTRRFGDTSMPGLRTLIADVLMGRQDVDVFEYAPELRPYVALELFSLGRFLQEENEAKRAHGLAPDHPGTVISPYERLIAHFGASGESQLQLAVAYAFLEIGRECEAAGFDEDAGQAFRKVVERFGNSDEVAFQEVVAQALMMREEFDQVIERYGGSDHTELQLLAAKSLTCKGGYLEPVDQRKALDAYDRVIREFGSSADPALRQVVAEALVLRYEIQRAHSPDHETSAACEELGRQLEGLRPDVNAGFAWYAVRELVKQYPVSDKVREAPEVFRRTYGVASVEWEAPRTIALRQDLLPSQLWEIVSGMIVAGVSEAEILTVLCEDKAKASELQPLVLALRKRLGEKPDAPEDALIAAAETNKDIEIAVIRGRQRLLLRRTEALALPVPHK